MNLGDIILKIDRLKEALDELRPLREDHLNRLNQKIRLDWNYHSNSIEGNTLSMSETKSFLLWGITAKGKPFRDYVEMKGHNDAVKKLYEIVHKDLKITETLIQEFHKLILVEPYADEVAEINPGKWKEHRNYLYSHFGERIYFAPPEEVPQLMNNLINWLNNHILPPKRKKKKYDLHPLLIATGFHSQFIKIHPFGDSNGRMARIMTNLILMLCGYVPVVVKQEQRNNYYTALNTSSLADLENLAVFLGKGVINTLEIAIKAGKGQSIEEEDDIDKQLQLLEKQLKAKSENTPLKSEERVHNILKLRIIPFFEKIILGLSKFDPFFEDVRFWITKRKNLSHQLTADNKDEIFNDFINSYPSYITIKYEASNFKEATENIEINLKLSVEFEKGFYVIADNLIHKSYQLKYNQYLSEEKQNEWIRLLQQYILNQIQRVVDK